MTYLKDLDKTAMALADTLSHQPPRDTLIYIHIGGCSQVELEDALDCLFLDDRRTFKLVDLKKMNNLVSALIVMEKIQPQIFFSPPLRNEKTNCLDETRQDDNGSEQGQTV